MQLKVIITYYVHESVTRFGAGMSFPPNCEISFPIFSRPIQGAPSFSILIFHDFSMTKKWKSMTYWQNI